jgi:lipoic acid synthetase
MDTDTIVPAGTETDERPQSAPLTLMPANRRARNTNIHLGTEQVTTERKPAWLTPKTKWTEERSPNYHDVRRLMRENGLHTVCEEARCPNISECWSYRTATFLILGDTCTRSCGFCAIKTGRPSELDWSEPERVARSVETLQLQHVVITSVNRDNLLLGGADIYAETIRLIKEYVPACTIEVLTPDFKGHWPALQMVVDAGPRILNHNVESVPRLYYCVRPQAKYGRSLEFLQRGKAMDQTGKMRTKSGMMLGLGETWDEILEVLTDLRAHEVDIVTIGQYLRPSFQHLPVQKYYPPEEFAELKVLAKAMGFRHVESGPMVRSSYRAHEQAAAADADEAATPATA